MIIRALLRLFSFTAYLLLSFAAVGWLMKHSFLEKRIIPYFNIFGDVSSISFMCMSILYFLAYILGSFYVQVAKCLSTSSQDSTTNSSLSKSKEEPVARVMRQIQSEFIGRLSGFLMAFVAATVAKVAMPIRVSLCLIYTASMTMYMFAAIFGAEALADAASAIAHVCCFKLFFYAYVPFYGAFAGMASDYFGMAIGQWQGILQKLRL